MNGVMMMENQERNDFTKLYYGNLMVYIKKYPYRYIEQDGVITLYDAPYSETEGEITIE